MAEYVALLEEAAGQGPLLTITIIDNDLLAVGMPAGSDRPEVVRALFDGAEFSIPALAARARRIVGRGRYVVRRDGREWAMTADVPFEGRLYHVKASAHLNRDGQLCLTIGLEMDDDFQWCFACTGQFLLARAGFVRLF
jgi:hypothetical protein